MKRIVLHVLSVCIIFLFFSGCNCASDSEISLKASVSFNDGHFYIFNESTFVWYNVELILNYEEGNLSSGYGYKTGLILGIEDIIGSDFINNEGMRFRYWKEEPIRLMISAETEDGRVGTYIKEW